MVSARWEGGYDSCPSLPEKGRISHCYSHLSLLLLKSEGGWPWSSLSLLEGSREEVVVSARWEGDHDLCLSPLRSGGLAMVIPIPLLLLRCERGWPWSSLCLF